MADNLTGLKRVLCAMGAADTKTLAECPPNEQLKYSMSAIFNINQALMSGAAMAFTLYSINNTFPPFMIIFLSTFWAFICFMLGFGLVGSISKAKQGNSNASLIVSLIIRLAITIVISLLTSQVLELYIFKDYFPLARRKQ
jgi:asparagine N-glycosylation enzyme membrane subunit Stt3